MSQAHDPVQLAKQGHPKAIAALLNRTLQTKGISANVSRKENCLQILIEGQQLNQKAITNFILKGLNSLAPAGIESVKMCGQTTGEAFPAWIEEISLKAAPQKPEISEASPPKADEQVCCPKCQSTQIVANKRGFSAGSAVAGAVLLGPLGVAGGLIGANQMFLNCIRCGYQWQLGTPAPKFKPQPQPTEAKVKRMTLAERLGAGVVTSFIVGLLLVLFLGKLAILAMIIVLAGFCFGIDEWTASLDGDCPHCGKEISASLDQKQKNCNHCHQPIRIESKNKSYWFHPES